MTPPWVINIYYDLDRQSSRWNCQIRVLQSAVKSGKRPIATSGQCKFNILSTSHLPFGTTSPMNSTATSRERSVSPLWRLL